MSKSHKNRIYQELTNVGIDSLSLFRAEGRYLPSVIYEDEHIGGAIYGLGQGGWCMLVATEKRVIYLDRKPFFTTKDILTYDIVSGIQSNTTGPFSSVTLQTRVGDYALRFVGKRAADVFIKYIESRRLSGGQYDQSSGRYFQEVDKNSKLQDVISQEAFDYIAEHDVAVLSTADKSGAPSGAVVHYVLDHDGRIYIVTKSGSQKARNIMNNPGVALTIHADGSLQTAQLQAEATVETRQDKQDQIFNHVVQERNYKEGKKSPPVTTLREGYYIVIRLTPTTVTYTDFSEK